MTKHKHTIEVKGKHYPLLFNYSAYKKIARSWQCNGIKEMMDQLQVIFSEENAMTFEALDQMGMMAKVGIETSGEVAPEIDDITDAIIFKKQQSVFIEAFKENLPDADPSGNVIPPQKKGGKKRTAKT